MLAPTKPLRGVDPSKPIAEFIPDVDDGRLFGNGVNYAAISPNGKYVAGGNDRVTIWEAETGKVLNTLPMTKCLGCTFSPDSRWLICNVKSENPKWESGLYFIDPATGREKDRLRSKSFRDPFWWSLDGDRFATRSRTEVFIYRLSKLDDRPKEMTIPPYSDTSLSPDGKTLLTASPKKTIAVIDGEVLTVRPKIPGIRLWDFTTAEEVKSTGSRYIGATKISFLPDGKRALAKIVTVEGSGNRKGFIDGGGPVHDQHTLVVLSADDLKEIARLDQETDDFIFSPDGNQFANKKDSVWKIYDTVSCKLIAKTLEIRADKAVFTPDGKRLLTWSNKTATIWELYK